MIFLNVGAGAGGLGAQVAGGRARPMIIPKCNILKPSFKIRPNFTLRRHLTVDIPKQSIAAQKTVSNLVRPVNIELFYPEDHTILSSRQQKEIVTAEDIVPKLLKLSLMDAPIPPDATNIEDGQLVTMTSDFNILLNKAYQTGNYELISQDPQVIEYLKELMQPLEQIPYPEGYLDAPTKQGDHS
jgi:hypothetical protein